jgi:hypothetical protein
VTRRTLDDDNRSGSGNQPSWSSTFQETNEHGERRREEEEERDMEYGPSVSDVGFTASVDASGAFFSLARRSSVDLAPAWLSDVRDMKMQIGSLTDNVVERVMRVLRLRDGRSTISGAKDLRRVTKDLDKVVRNMLVIGGNLSQAKELRDFFEDVIDKVCDPILGALYDGVEETTGGVGVVAEMKTTMEGGVFGHTREFFRAVFDVSCETATIRALHPSRRERLLSSWRRYLDVIGCCTLRMMRKRLSLRQ